MANILTSFKDFLLRGNLIDLAVAVVIGLAFVALINSLVTNLITPLVAMIVSEPALGSLDFVINDAVFFYGQFLDDLVTFIATAAAVYFFIVVPYNQFMVARARGHGQPSATTQVCPECISTIPIEAKRCMYCTSQVTA
jgi:large conductance mechanosensitive channel